MNDSMSEMVANWRSGTSELFNEQLIEMNEMYPDTYQSIMVDRNNVWMPQLEAFMKDDPTEFVVVGALHLHGAEGLLDMLKAKGFQIEQVK